MSADPTAPRPGIPRLYLALGGLAAAAVLWIVLGSPLGSRRPGAGTRATATDPDAAPENSVEAAADLLRRSPDLDACRHAVQMLNAHLVRDPEHKTKPLTKDERKRWRDELGLDEEELDEVSSSEFTNLDAFHLEQCCFLGDAARGLMLDGLPDRDRAAAAFAWVVRQVRLRTDQTGLLPPLLVLRRGWGNAEERALVFLELLRQLDIPGGLAVVPTDGGVRPWLPAVLHDGEFHLFDARLGEPIPGPPGQPIATLSQVRKQPELLPSLGIDAEHPYDVTAEQASRAELWIACPLSFLAPRMKSLQEALGPSVRIADDPKRMADRIRQGTKGGPVVVRVWTAAQNPDVPTRTLRTTLPNPEGRRDRFGDRYRLLFEAKIVPPQTTLVGYLPQIHIQPFLELCAASPSPKNLMIRGRFTEALVALEDTLERMDEVANTFAAEPEATNLVDQWVRTVQPAVREWQEAGQAARQNPGSEAQERLARSQGRLATIEKYTQAALGALAEVHKAKRFVKQNPDPEARERLTAAEAYLESFKGVKEPILQIQLAAGQVLIPQILYLRALCKQDQAEVAQRLLNRTPNAPAAEADVVKDAWTAAADAWQDYLNRAPPDEAAAAAILQRARVLERLGQREAAAALLANPPPLTGWNATAWHYRARQLQRR